MCGTHPTVRDTHRLRRVLRPRRDREDGRGACRAGGRSIPSSPSTSSRRGWTAAIGRSCSTSASRSSTRSSACEDDLLIPMGELVGPAARTRSRPRDRRLLPPRHPERQGHRVPPPPGLPARPQPPRRHRGLGGDDRPVAARDTEPVATCSGGIRSPSPESRADISDLTGPVFGANLGLSGSYIDG